MFPSWSTTFVLCMGLCSLMNGALAQYDEGASIEDFEFRSACTTANNVCERMADTCCPGLQCIGCNPLDPDDDGHCSCQ
uniref:U-scoloptoxin(13)-Er1a n=1 Tax=Ethmostigmus rubripes TaxID=62613 RepID=TXD1A_ETHRU|nr:RecName: Full=U-scoloptoxin(13)-Er1a; Short=U-SLPTX(13)-Er1a; Flags: Precursor [Ethmostigmus rubripes]